MEDSHVFRPGRSCHQALRVLSQEVEDGPINHIVEADIKGFFDNVNQAWLMRFLEHRIQDRRLLRMIWRFLKAGIAEDGEIRASEEGTPQGGVISPMLANIYLHYVLDLWFERVFRKSCGGRARMIRFADDHVVCFQYKEEAERFQQAMIERLGRFGLAIELTKTKVLAFGRWAATNAKARGQEPETFDFLGFTHYCSRTRNGKRFRMKRVTSRKKFRKSVAAFKRWVKQVRTEPIREIWAMAAAKLRGHYQYYGVTDNHRGIVRFYEAVKRLLVKWLCRRSQRRRLTWEKFNLMLQRHPLPVPRLHADLIRKRAFASE